MCITQIYVSYAADMWHLTADSKMPARSTLGTKRVLLYCYEAGVHVHNTYFNSIFPRI